MCASITKFLAFNRTFNAVFGTNLEVRRKYNRLLRKYQDPFSHLEVYVTGLSEEDKIDASLELKWAREAGPKRIRYDVGNAWEYGLLRGFWRKVAARAGADLGHFAAGVWLRTDWFEGHYDSYHNPYYYAYLRWYRTRRDKRLIHYAYRWHNFAFSELIRQRLNKKEFLKYQKLLFPGLFYGVDWNERDVSFEFRSRTYSQKYREFIQESLEENLSTVEDLEDLEEEDRLVFNHEFCEEHPASDVLLYFFLLKRKKYLARVDSLYVEGGLEFDQKLWNKNLKRIRRVEYKLATPWQRARIKDDRARRSLWLDLREVVDPEAPSVIDAVRKFNNKVTLSDRAVKVFDTLQYIHVDRFFRGACLPTYSINIETGVANLSFWRRFDERWEERLNTLKHLNCLRSIILRNEFTLFAKTAELAFKNRENFQGVLGYWDIPLLRQPEWAQSYLSKYTNFFPYYTKLYSWFQKPGLASFYKNAVFGLLGSAIWPEWCLVFTMTRKRKNMYLTVTDMVGKVLLTLSAGAFHIHYRKRANPRALAPLFTRVVECFNEYGIHNAIIVMRFDALYLYRHAGRFFKRNNISVLAVLDKFLITHNGMKGKRRKRL